MRVIAAIVVPVALWFLLILAFLAVPLPHPLPAPWGMERNKIGAVLTGVAGLAYLVFLVVFVVGELDSTARPLDEAVRPLGLASGPRLPGFRTYEGQLVGRSVTLSTVPAVALQRASLTATVEARPPVRLSVGRTAPLEGCAGCRPVTLARGPLAGMVARSDDPERAAAVFSSGRAADLAAALLGDADALGNRFLHLEPSRVRLEARPTAAGLGRAGEWLRQMVELAGECELAAGTR